MLFIIYLGLLFGFFPARVLLLGCISGFEKSDFFEVLCCEFYLGMFSRFFGGRYYNRTDLGFMGKGVRCLSKELRVFA